MDIFRFSGDVVAKASDKSSPEDVCPADMKAWIDSIPEDVSEAEIEFASMGGDVFAGIQMANMVKGLSQRGVKVKASVTSIAASIASVVVCACDEIELWDGAFLMVHLPWTCVQGNASDLKKEAAVLDQCKQAMLAFYRTKFNVSDEEIEKMLEAETWIDSVNFGMYGLAAAVSPKEAPKIAASLNSRNFKNLPKGFKMEEETKELIEEKKPEAAQEPEKPAEEPKAEEAPAEEKPAEPALEELKKKLEEKDAEIEELKKQLEEAVSQKPASDAEARVSGMQSAMQKKLNAQAHEFEAKLESKSQELAQAKAEATSLKAKVDKAEGELSEMASALEASRNALAELNASVNEPGQAKDWRQLKGKAFWAWLKENNVR